MYVSRRQYYNDKLRTVKDTFISYNFESLKDNQYGGGVNVIPQSPYGNFAKFPTISNLNNIRLQYPNKIILANSSPRHIRLPMKCKRIFGFLSQTLWKLLSIPVWNGIKFGGQENLPSPSINLSGLKVSGSGQKFGSICTAHCSGIIIVSFGIENPANSVFCKKYRWGENFVWI